MKFRFLHTNDFHGKLTPLTVAKLRDVRSDVDAYFDCGDLIRTGNLGVPLSADPAWPLLSDLDCTASVLGNRETHPLRNAFEKKIEGCRHPLLVANMHARVGAPPTEQGLVIEANGIRVGVFGVMVAMATPRMKTSRAWAYLWDPPIETAVRVAREMRSSVDLLVALTHIGLAQDRLLAERCPEIDIIAGGHSHSVLQTPERVGKTWIVQGGSHGRYAGVYEWEDGILTGGLTPLGEKR